MVTFAPQIFAFHQYPRPPVVPETNDRQFVSLPSDLHKRSSPEVSRSKKKKKKGPQNFRTACKVPKEKKVFKTSEESVCPLNIFIFAPRLPPPTFDILVPPL